MSKYAKLWDKKADLVSEADKHTPWYKMMRWMGHNERVLDVGCSSGYFGEKLITAKNDTVWGLEIDHADAEKARRRGYEAVFEGDLDNFDWSQLKGLVFDTVIFVDVLEHVKNPLAVLKAVQQFLAPNGTIYVSIPNVAHISLRVELMEGNFDYEDTGLLDSTHIRFFTAKNVMQLFYDAGMEIIHRDATLNDVSDGQVKAHLRKLGLEPTKAFDAILASSEARTFQHIVAAKKTTRTPKKPPELLLPSKLHDEWPAISKILNENDNRIKTLEAEVTSLRQTNDELEGTVRALHDRIAYIKRHPLKWAVKGVARKVARRGKGTQH